MIGMEWCLTKMKFAGELLQGNRTRLRLANQGARVPIGGIVAHLLDETIMKGGTGETAQILSTTDDTTVSDDEDEAEACVARCLYNISLL